jgi:hypothetical protein
MQELEPLKLDKEALFKRARMLDEVLAPMEDWAVNLARQHADDDAKFDAEVARKEAIKNQGQEEQFHIFKRDVEEKVSPQHQGKLNFVCGNGQSQDPASIMLLPFFSAGTGAQPDVSLVLACQCEADRQLL